jgi:plasmid stabilization system protein ParE
VKRLTYLSIAEIELVEALRFYDEQEDGLGKIFLDAVAEAGEKIRRSPRLWSFYEKPVRGYRIMPFPYRLLYRELSDRVQIVAVFHLSRRPGSWKNRLK